MNALKVKIVNKSQWPDPAYATEASAGMDLRANITEPIVLKPLERVLVPTGIFIELPVGYEAQVRPRSGLATKHGITVINSPGTVDADYRGELKTSLVNLSNEPFEIVPGERIAQMVVARHERVEWEDVEVLSETERGAGGWGSTGKRSTFLCWFTPSRFATAPVGHWGPYSPNPLRRFAPSLLFCIITIIFKKYFWICFLIWMCRDYIRHFWNAGV